MKMIKKIVLLQSLKKGDKFFIKKENGFRGYQIKKAFLEYMVVESLFSRKKRIIPSIAEVYFLQEINEKNDRKNIFLNVFTALFLNVFSVGK